MKFNFWYYRGSIESWLICKDRQRQVIEAEASDIQMAQVIFAKTKLDESKIGGIDDSCEIIELLEPKEFMVSGYRYKVVPATEVNHSSHNKR